MTKTEIIWCKNVVLTVAMMAVLLMLLVVAMKDCELPALEFEYQCSFQETVVRFKLSLLVPVSGGGAIWLWSVQSRRKRRRKRNRPS